MAIIPFDTLDYSKTLQEAGFAQAHAEALARAQKSAFGQLSEQNRQELATKTDLQAEIANLRVDMAEHRNATKTDLLELKNELKSDMGKLRSDMRSDLAALKHDILRWTLSFVIGMSGFLAGVMYFFLRTMR